MTWEGVIPRKRRTSFERFVHHDDPRIRAVADEMLEADRTTRELMRAEAEGDEAWAETSERTRSEADDHTGAKPDGETGLTEIPF